MFSSIASFIFGNSSGTEDEVLTTKESHEDLDTLSEEEEWIFVVKSPNQAPGAVILSQSEERAERVIQPINTKLKAKKAKSQKVRLTAGRPQAQQNNSNSLNRDFLTSKQLLSSHIFDRSHPSVIASQAYRCNRKSLERNNKCLHFNSKQGKPQMYNINLRYSSKQDRTC